jgi:phage terminase large subunit-like protein
MMARASKEASAALRFLPKLVVPEGRLAGKRLRLASYQKDFVRGAFAKGIEAGCLSVGRGAAKTALSAGIALGHLMGEIAPQPKREIIFAARNRDQAKTAFGFLLGFIEGLPEDAQEQFTIRRGSKLEVETAENGGGLARVIAADGKSILGGAPTLAILDERAAWEREKGDALENAILSGLGKRDGRALIISTSAPDDANTFSRWLDEPPPGTFVQEHRPDPGLPPDDLASLLVANPGAAEGIGPSAEWLTAQARRAIARGGSALSSFRNLNRNERVASDNRSVLLTVDEWLACEVAPDDLPPRDGPVVLGVDLGGSRSMSAAALYWPDTGRLELLEALRDAGLERVPFIWRGFGWKDGSEDIERTRRAVFEGQVRTVPSLLLRSAFSDAITLVDPAGNHKLAAGRSTGRVDPVAATVVAVAQGQRMKRAPAISGGRMAWA